MFIGKALFPNEIIKDTLKLDYDSLEELFNASYGKDGYDYFNEEVVSKFYNNKYLHFIVADSDEFLLSLKFIDKFYNGEDIFYDFRFVNSNSIEMYNVLKNFSDKDFSKYILLHVDDNTERIGFNKFMKMMNPLKDIDSRVSRPNYSQLEKIMMAYDSVKKREYKDLGNEDKSISRTLSNVLTNEDKEIVCVGFTKVFNECLRINDIKCFEYGFSANDGQVNHMVSLVNVDDDKYDIHGIYVFDLCEDCYTSNKSKEENEEKYRGFLMSFDQFKEKYKVSQDFYENYLNMSREEVQENLDMYDSMSEDTFVDSLKLDNENSFKITKFIELDSKLLDGKSEMFYCKNAVSQNAEVLRIVGNLLDTMGETINSNDDRLIHLFRYVNCRIQRKNEKSCTRGLLNRDCSNAIDISKKVLRK